MRGRTMNTTKRILWSAGALVLVAAPAVIGLWGNASFAESVPVRVPASGEISTPSPSPTSTSTPSPSATPVDDHGGDVPRDQRVEPGDDRDVQGGVVPVPSPSSSSSGDDHGGDDHGGHGGDDERGGDDHGGHGGDD